MALSFLTLTRWVSLIQMMLDYSKYHDQLALFRTTTDGKLWRQFHLNITDVPALFVVLRNGTAQRILIKRNMR